jgi:hypothetical protein
MGDLNPQPRGREEDELPLSYKSSCVYLQKFVYIYIKNMLVRVAFYIRNVQIEEHLQGSSFSF